MARTEVRRLALENESQREGVMEVTMGKPVDILLVEDSPGDARLAQEALKDAKVRNYLSVVEDGIEAMAFLRCEGPYADAPRPDVILLDLNLPRKDGREVLAEIKADEDLRRIPVVVLTVSKAEEDVLRSYDLHANCYIAKPLDLDQFIEVVRSIENFWLTIVTLPTNDRNAS
jgi:two-component system, chemotaxis family, response regulator Rcp1